MHNCKQETKRPSYIKRSKRKAHKLFRHLSYKLQYVGTRHPPRLHLAAPVHRSEKVSTAAAVNQLSPIVCQLSALPSSLINHTQ